MTRWLYMCNDLGIPLDGTKGASEHVRAITRALSRSGAVVQVLAARGRLPVGHPASQIETPLGEAARAISEELRQWLDRVDAPTGMAGELGQMIYDARLHDSLKGNSTSMQADVVLERLSLFSTAGSRLAERLGATYLVEMNAPLSQEAARYRDAGLQALAQRVESRVLQSADRVLTVSDALRDYVVRELGVSDDRVVSVPNGVDLELFRRLPDRAAARALAGVPGDALVFGFVGTLRAWHGIDVLLDAFHLARRQLGNAHLLVVGDVRRAEQHRDRAAGLGILDSTTFFGEARHEKVPALLAAMDVAVAPYLPQDTFYFSPLKLFEYLAAGLCTIASRAGQISEVIEHRRNGLLTTPGSSDDLARAMVEAGRNPDLRSRLGAAARKSVSNRGWDTVATRITELAVDALREGQSSVKEGMNVG